MELVKSTYKILFSLEITLAGYPDDAMQYIKVVPDIPTRELLRTYRILSRNQKNTDVSLILVESDGVEQDSPEIPLQDNEVFRFYIKIPDRTFLSRTHLAAYDLDASVLLLSNEVNHIVGTELLLSRALNGYNAGDDYEPGYLVQSGSDFFQALQASNAGDPHPVTDAAYWQPVADGTFVSQADLQPRPASADRDSIMIIDVRHSAVLPADYQLLDGTSKCKEVTFKIKLLP